MKKLCLVMVCLLAAFAAYADGLRMPKHFGDNMVLQQNSNANIWGWADAGARVKVSVSWSQDKYCVKADSNGFWKVAVATPAATFSPQTVKIRCGKDKVELKNMLIGEVWLCGGQSNMEMPLGGWSYQPIEGGAEAMRDSHKYPGLRMVYMDRVISDQLQDDLDGKWKVAGEDMASWSAVAYFFGKRLTEELNVPVGLVVCCWGGSLVECWMDRATLNSLGVKDEVIDYELKNYTDSPWTVSSAMYNAMLYPIRHYTINGIIWYQGCSNVSRVYTQDYAQFLAAMVNLWRESFKCGNVPFYYVQIAPHPYSGYNDTGLAALLRDRQRAAASIIPNSGMVPTCDLVYEYEMGIIHPRQKEPVGDRLAYMALENWYGIKGLGSASPEFERMETDGAKAKIWFKNVTGGLHGNTGWEFKGVDGFEAAGEDGIWHPASVRDNSGNMIELSCEAAGNIKKVRYLWHDFAIGQLWNGYNMPVLPFCTE